MAHGYEIEHNSHICKSSYGENLKHMFDGIHFQFPSFKHEHHGPVVNVNFTKVFFFEPDQGRHDASTH